MHATFEELETMVESEEFESQSADWGDMHVAIETAHAEMDTTPFLKGLPDDRCQCPHWGYLLDGRVHVNYPDREETIEAGEVYYLEPGHRVRAEAGSKSIEFSPKEGYQQSMEVMMENYEKMQAEM